jgi:tetratricopeptide (TPR) repeat protein
MSAAGYSNRGGLYLEDEKLDAAIRDFNSAIQIDASRAEPFYSRGTALLKKGDTDRALKDLDEALRIRPDLAAAYTSRAQAIHTEPRRLFAGSRADAAERGCMVQTRQRSPGPAPVRCGRTGL